MDEGRLDLIMVPLGLLLLAAYHLWLLYAIIRHPTRTVVGLNALSRKRWVAHMMTNPEKNGVMAIQTLRNNIMASTVLATTAITLVSVISVFIGATSNRSQVSSVSSASLLIYGNKTNLVFSVKYFAISLCFILAFVCNIQAIRFYAHASFLMCLPPRTAPKEDGEFVAYVSRSVNSGSHFWSLGLRAFYVSFTLFLWTFGPIPMLVGSVVMCCLLYLLDTTKEYAGGIHGSCSEEEAKKESA